MCNLHRCCTFCTGVTLFALVLHLNCTALSQSESINFFMCIISRIICPSWQTQPNRFLKLIMIINSFMQSVRAFPNHEGRKRIFQLVLPIYRRLHSPILLPYKQFAAKLYNMHCQKSKMRVL